MEKDKKRELERVEREMNGCLDSALGSPERKERGVWGLGVALFQIWGKLKLTDKTKTESMFCGSTVGFWCPGARIRSSKISGFAKPYPGCSFLEDKSLPHDRTSLQNTMMPAEQACAMLWTLRRKAERAKVTALPFAPHLKTPSTQHEKQCKSLMSEFVQCASALLPV